MTGYARVFNEDVADCYEGCGDNPREALQTLVDILDIYGIEYIRALNVQQVEEGSWCVTCYA